MSLVDQIISSESGGDPNAKNPNSSASGPSQFIDSTWLAMLAKHRPDIQGSPDQLLALKNDPNLSRDMTAAYAADNAKSLQSAGYEPSDGNLYLAHFAGPQGAARVLGADPNAPISSILGDAAVKANPFLKGMRAADLQAWAARKVGGSAPAPAQNNAPVSQPAPANAAPPPVPAQQPTQDQTTALQSQPQPSNSLYGQMPADQIAMPPPIFTPQRKPIDLSKLQAALQASGNRGPIFLKG